MLFSTLQEPVNGILLSLSGGGMSLQEGTAVPSLPNAASRQRLQLRRRTGARAGSWDTAGQAGEAHRCPASP